tara:strand:- start:23076 stop:23498 length:423 start_codon:yes stop_codon:yes gene_type:complete
MNTTATITWLKIAAGATFASGLLFAASVWAPAAWPTAAFFDLAFPPLDGAPALQGEGFALLRGISGGVLVGWSVMLWMIATRLYPTDPRLGGSIILTGISTWFVIDSTASIAAGAPWNAVYNLIFLALFVVPVLLGRRAV